MRRLRTAIRRVSTAGESGTSCGAESLSSYPALNLKAEEKCKYVHLRHENPVQEFNSFQKEFTYGLSLARKWDCPENGLRNKAHRRTATRHEDMLNPEDREKSRQPDPCRHSGAISVSVRRMKIHSRYADKVSKTCADSGSEDASSSDALLDVTL